jgi:hypothetical protein
MPLLIPVIAIIATASFLGLAARRRGIPPVRAWTWSLLPSAILTIAGFTQINDLSRFLLELYWTKLPFNQDLDSIKLFLSACIWFAAAIGASLLGGRLMTHASGSKPIDTGLPAGSWIVGGFTMVLIAFVAFLFANSHAPNVDFFEKLKRSADAWVVDLWVYRVLVASAAVVALVGIALVSRGYFLHARKVR